MSEKFPEYVVTDLMKKCAEDVSRAMMRTLSLFPRDQQLPIAMAAGASVIGIMSAVLDTDRDRIPEGQASPDPQCVLLAGLLCARCSLAPNGDGISKAYADLKTLTGE